MILTPKSLKQIFGDPDYAWHLLQQEIKLQTSRQITGEDISHLLQLYMRGVEKMNSQADIRQSYFKNKVTSLMTRPAVIKILNKPMSKKSQAPVVQSASIKRIDTITELHLRQKRKQMQMRLAYNINEQQNPDILKKMLAQQNQKQSILTNKIEKIVDSHEESLMKRIRQRKLRTMTAKSRSEICNNDINGVGEMDFKTKIQMIEKRRDEEQFGGTYLHKKQKLSKRKTKNLSLSRSKFQKYQQLSPSKRRVSMDFKQLKSYNSLNIEDLHKH